VRPRQARYQVTLRRGHLPGRAARLVGSSKASNRRIARTIRHSASLLINALVFTNIVSTPGFVGYKEVIRKRSSRTSDMFGSTGTVRRLTGVTAINEST
jgi:hypothetical protein